jgi:hypothetical protein
MLAGVAAGAGGIGDGASGGSGTAARLLAAPRPAFPVERCVGSRFICTESLADIGLRRAMLLTGNQQSE